MRFGAVFPHNEIGADPGAVRAWAQGVEDLGYHHILAFDHVLGAGTTNRPGWRGYSSEHRFHEVFVLFGYLAGLTTTIELMTGVLVLPQRQTALVAKQAAEVDVLSGGRLRLGVGLGWNQVEYEALGQPFSHRGAKLGEQVELLRALWAQPTVSYTGRWDEVVDAGIEPRPTRGTIPVWFGGHVEATLRRIGRIGDGWLPHIAPDSTAGAMVERMRGYALDAGRDPGDIGLQPRLTLAATPADTRVEYVNRWRALGATHFDIDALGLGSSSVDQHLAVLEETIAALAP
ncbi:LLM class F420-dependent oxidoreductase [Nocardia sp. GAS34]|uniref:LLM class F420-dependent oxidoreductase n=1 Tax=unclassified Nocardia TaxID=2637762 RepID=UPI003D21D000